jgi:predicted dehydrogenase
LETFRTHPDCSVVAVADPDPVKLGMASQKWPEIARESQAEMVIDNPSIDVVCIASPDNVHYEQIARSLHSGKHVFAEKPLCLLEEHTAAIWRALSDSPRLRLSSNTVLRRSPRFRDLRERIERGELGRIFMVDADYNYGRLWKLTDGWRGGIGGYSVMLGGGIHMVDLAMWLVGCKVTEVHAFGNNICTEGTFFNGNDVVVAVVRFDDGSIGKLAANFGCVEPHFHRLTIYGTEATFENGRGTATICRSRDPNQKPDQLFTPYPAVPKGALIPSFIDAILRNSQPDVDENDVFDTMAVCHAIDRSLSTGAPSSVAYYGKLPQVSGRA